MADLKLRDRDAIITREGIIFRVYGYSHPSKAYICDPEYARASIYESKDPRAYRAKGNQTYYKFYADEGLRFVRRRYPQHMVWVEPLGEKLVGVHEQDIWKTRQPSKALRSLLRKRFRDSLLEALHSLLALVLPRSDLSLSDVGVFGSLLNNFYHPGFSDLDCTVYGRDNVKRLVETLETLYQEADSPLQNEFARPEVAKEKDWKFLNYSLKEYIRHQKRKQIYGLFHHQQSGRRLKAEFEPVKRWDEIHNEYSQVARVSRIGWIKLKARVTSAMDAAFMPSIYQIEPIKILDGTCVDNLQRVISFVEEFRLQAKQDELVIVEGNLEQVTTAKESFQQVTLTQGPRYYEQTLKLA